MFDPGSNIDVDSHSFTISLPNARCLRSHAVDTSKLKTLIKTDKICLTESQICAGYTAQKMKFSIKNFFSKCDQIRRELADLVTFTEEILNGILRFLCNVMIQVMYVKNLELLQSISTCVEKDLRILHFLHLFIRY